MALGVARGTLGVICIWVFLFNHMQSSLSNLELLFQTILVVYMDFFSFPFLFTQKQQRIILSWHCIPASKHGWQQWQVLGERRLRRVRVTRAESNSQEGLDSGWGPDSLKCLWYVYYLPQDKVCGQVLWGNPERYLVSKELSMEINCIEIINHY